MRGQGSRLKNVVFVFCVCDQQFQTLRYIQFITAGDTEHTQIFKPEVQYLFRLVLK